MSGMTRGAFYHHFKSKEEVLDALSNKLVFDHNRDMIAKSKEIDFFAFFCTGKSGIMQLDDLYLTQYIFG